MGSTRHVALLSIPGLRAPDLQHMPRLAALGSRRASLTPSFPCVTWPVQAVMPLVFMVASFRHGAYALYPGLRPVASDEAATPGAAAGREAGC